MANYKGKAGFICSVLLALAITVVPKYWELRIDSIPPLLPPPPAIDPLSLPRTEVVENTIQKNTTLVATLADYDVPAEIAHEVAALVKPVFDLRKLRNGNPFRLEKESNGTLTRFEYKIDDESVLKVQKKTDAYE